MNTGGHRTKHQDINVITLMIREILALPSILSASTLNPSSLVISNCKYGWSLLVGHSSSFSDAGGSSSEVEAAPGKHKHNSYKSVFHISSSSDLMVERRSCGAGSVVVTFDQSAFSPILYLMSNTADKVEIVCYTFTTHAYQSISSSQSSCSVQLVPKHAACLVHPRTCNPKDQT